MTTLGVYIQVPFCQTKCTYCNFHTGVAARAAYAPYARAVEREIRLYSRESDLPRKGYLQDAFFAANKDIRSFRALTKSALHAAANFASAGRFSSGDTAPISCHPEPPGSPARAAFERAGAGSEGSAFRPIREADPSGAILDTIYLGGGTPSLFDPADLARILDAVRSQFSCADNDAGVSSSARAASTATSTAASTVAQPILAVPIIRVPRARAASTTEITLEADPETVTPEKAARWLAAGINRVSLGAQSFHDAELQAAGRMHRRENIFSAIEHLRTTGFGNVSLDLIAGLPHQTAASWQASVEEALRLRPEHISIYLFEIDEGSRLGKELLSGGARYSAAAVPSEDAMADSYEFACERLARAGYDHYEISNWALPGFRSRHNLKYWRREPYLGFGAGAHSFDGHSRWANAHDPAAYVAAIEQGRLPIEQLEEVTPRQALEEELFLGLRQLEGIDVAPIEMEYQAQYNVNLGARIEELRAQGLLERTGSRVRLAPARLTVSNEVFVALLD